MGGGGGGGGGGCEAQRSTVMRAMGAMGEFVVEKLDIIGFLYPDIGLTEFLEGEEEA